MAFTPFFLLPFLHLDNSPPSVIFRHLLALSLFAHLRRTPYSVSLSLSSFMTPVYRKSPFVVQKDEDHQLFKLSSFSSNQASSSLSCAASFSTVGDQKGCQLDDRQSRQTLDDDLKVGKSLFFVESNDHAVISSPSSSRSPVIHEDRATIITGNGEEDHSSEIDFQRSVKWMTSKKRIIQEMANNDAQAEAARQDSGNRQHDKSVMTSSSICNSNNITIRVCSDCKTTTTPLWRSGPEGPKSLCNACGIRQRKARRALAEAAVAAANSTLVSPNPPSPKQKKVKKSRKTSHVGQSKSKTKLTDTDNGERKLSLSNLALGLSKTSALGRVFPRDEEEATILLMELSRGIVQG